MKKSTRYIILASCLFVALVLLVCILGKGDGGEEPPVGPEPYRLQRATLDEHWMGDTLYIGEWVKAKPHGCGTMVYPDSTVHSGFWLEGKREGMFRMWFPNDSVSYAQWQGDTIAAVIDSLLVDRRHGVDLSKYQYAHWSSMLIELDTTYLPIQFVILKASEGKSHKDPYYPYHSRLATLTHMQQGAYHLFWPSEEVGLQVSNFLEAIEGRTIDGPIVLDIEGSTLEISRKAFNAMKPNIKCWLHDVEAALGQKPMIYCCYDFYKNYGQADIFAGYDFWIASYRSSLNTNWVMHQYSEKGKVIDWPMRVDLDFEANCIGESGESGS